MSAEAAIIQRVGGALAALPFGSILVGLGGAHAKGQADIHSDIDFYVFASNIPKVEALQAEMEPLLPDAAGFETWSRADEAGIEMKLDGRVVEIWFRDTATVFASAERALRGCFEKEDRVWTPNGFYQTSALADLMAMQVLTCRDGDFARMLERIAAYPEALRQAAFNAGLAPQRFWKGSMHLDTAIARVDGYYLESILHQIRAGLIQAAFALNRKYFGGDKKMALSLGALPSLPDGFARTVLDMKSPNSAKGWRARFDEVFAAGDQLCTMIAEEPA